MPAVTPLCRSSLPPSSRKRTRSASRSNRFAAARGLGRVRGRSRRHGRRARRCSVISRPGAGARADSPLAALDLSALQDTIASVRSEIAALKASVDTGARNSNAQFAKAAERFERIERAQSAPAAKLAKSHRMLDRRTDSASTATGCHRLGRGRPVRRRRRRTRSAARCSTAGWCATSVRNVAVIQGRRMGVIEVETRRHRPRRRPHRGDPQAHGWPLGRGDLERL